MGDVLSIATSLIAGSIRVSIPIAFAALGGTLSERSGIINMGLEGTMLMGAFFGVVGSYYSQNVWIGLLVAMLAGALVVSWDNFGFQESFAASLTCISNVGPGLGILGPMENFSILSPLSKIALSLEMLTGRLELMPMLALLTRGAWRDR